MERTILVVDDFDDAREFMKFIIEGYGYKVVEAADGMQAIEKLKQHFPDLILMDIAMPLMDGLTATKNIRTIKHGADIPIIAVTAHGKDFYNKAIAAGCNAMIEKPVDFDDLEVVIKNYLEDQASDEKSF